jgi:hypothetical protein
MTTEEREIRRFKFQRRRALAQAAAIKALRPHEEAGDAIKVQIWAGGVLVAESMERLACLYSLAAIREREEPKPLVGANGAK